MEPPNVHGKYDPERYWESRLSSQTVHRGTGHISFTEGYNTWLYKAKLRALKRAIADLPLKGRSVLDVGSGHGFFVDWFVQKGANVDGLDITTTSIASLRDRFPGNFRQLDISEDSEIPLGSYDIVNAWDVMYHLVDDARFARAMHRLAAAVAPGGLLLVTDRLAAAADLRPAEHVHMRVLATYQRHLADTELEFVGLHFLYGWLNQYVSHPSIDSRLARLYYWLDGRAKAVPADNLSLGVWRRIASS